jgi:hypothetical protein
MSRLRMTNGIVPNWKVEKEKRRRRIKQSHCLSSIPRWRRKASSMFYKRANWHFSAASFPPFSTKRSPYTTSRPSWRSSKKDSELNSVQNVCLRSDFKTSPTPPGRMQNGVVEKKPTARPKPAVETPSTGKAELDSEDDRRQDKNKPRNSIASGSGSDFHSMNSLEIQFSWHFRWLSFPLHHRIKL